MGSAGFQPAVSGFQPDTGVHPAHGIPCAGCAPDSRWKHESAGWKPALPANCPLSITVKETLI